MAVKLSTYVLPSQLGGFVHGYVLEYPEGKAMAYAGRKKTEAEARAWAENALEVVAPPISRAAIERAQHLVNWSGQVLLKPGERAELSEFIAATRLGLPA